MKKTTKITLGVIGAIIIVSGCASSPEDEGTTIVDSKQEQPAKKIEKEAKVGTKDNPVPATKAAKVGDDWNVGVSKFSPNANAVVQKTNEFNDAPAAGKQYVMATMSVSYTGEETGTPWVDLQMKVLDTNGNTFPSHDCMAVIPNPLMDVSELFPGAKGTGNTCFVVPTASVTDLTLIVESGFGANRVFFKL